MELIVDQTALTRLNKKLTDYKLVLKRLTIPEILDKKGNDLRIQLWKLFWYQKFGGPGKKKESIASKELARRAKSGKGIIVRARELDAKWGTPPDIANGRKRKGYKLSLWQKLVWQELQRRISGIGLLAIGFLSRRFRSNNARGRYLVENVSKSLGPLVQIKKEETSFTITGFTPYLVELSNRYNIANRAIAGVEKDIDKYLDRKLAEARKTVFGT